MNGSRRCAAERRARRPAGEQHQGGAEPGSCVGSTRPGKQPDRQAGAAGARAGRRACGRATRAEGAVLQHRHGHHGGGVGTDAVRGGGRRGVMRSLRDRGRVGRGTRPGGAGGCGRATRKPGAGLPRHRVDDRDLARRAGRSPSGRWPGRARCRRRRGRWACRTARRPGRGRPAAMPAPWSATSSRTGASAAGPCPATPAPLPGRAVPRGVVEQVRDQLVQPGAVGVRTVRSSGTTRTSYVTGRASVPPRRPRRREQRARAGSRRPARAITPASTRDRSSRSPTSALSRSAWASAVRMSSGSARSTPSSRFSSTPISAGQRGPQLVGDASPPGRGAAGRPWPGRPPSG